MNGTILRGIIGLLGREKLLPDGSALTDAALLGRWVSVRDEAAFETLVWRHSATVLGVCRRVLGDAHEAEDATQAAFLALARQARSLGRRQAVASWLYTVAYRTALRARNRRGRGPTLRAHGLDALAAHPDADPAWRDLRPLLDEEVGRLPDKYRAPFVLCHVQGRTNEEAARELCCPVGTIQSRLARARQRLRDRLTRRGVVLAPAALVAATAGDGHAAPGGLIRATARAAALRAAGRSANGVVSPKVIALSEGVLRAMLFSKLTWGIGALFAAVLVVGGFLDYRAIAGPAPEPAPNAGRPAAAVRRADADKPQLPKEKDDRIKALEEKLAEATRRLECALLANRLNEIKDRLATAAGGPATQEMQEEVIARVDGLVKGLEDEQEKKPDPKRADLIAELTMVRSLQAQVNKRTVFCSKPFKGEAVPSPDAAQPGGEKDRLVEARTELKSLSEREEKIGKIVLELAREKKPAQ